MEEMEEILKLVLFIFTCLGEIWSYRFVVSSFLEAKSQQDQSNAQWDLLLHPIEPEHNNEIRKQEVSKLDNKSMNLLSNLQRELEITIDDYQTDEIFEEYASDFEEYASCQIADGVAGPQRWVVQVIGIEENYAHIQDSSKMRVWVDLGDFSVQIGDILMLDVNRSAEKIDISNVTVLESAPIVTSDYAIPDEDITPFQENII